DCKYLSTFCEVADVSLVNKMSSGVGVSQTTKKSLRKRIINADKKEDVVRQRLTEFYCHELMKDVLLRSHFHTDSVALVGAGAFGQVFQILAKKDITYGELEAITTALTKEEKHDYLNKVTPIRFPNRSEIAIKRSSTVALKCETAFNFQLENFPVNPKSLPDAITENFTLFKEYNTLCSIFKRFGFKDTRGFTKPYAFGRLGDYSFTSFKGSTRTKHFGFHFLLLELCGPDLEDMLEVCSHNCRQNDQRLSTRTVFLIGDQFISRLQCLQEPSIGLSHNDLKCDQLMSGRGENINTIFLIDYGLVTKYKEAWGTTAAVPPMGNRRWAPRSNHQMACRTPLCEIESACYVLLRLLKNHFPWDGMFDKQVMKLQELKDRGEEDILTKTGDQVLYEEKQFLWMYLKKMSGRKVMRMKDDIEQEIDKFKDFFDERNDKWGDGGTQMQELMVDLAKMGDPIYCSFTERKLDFADVNYIGIRKHLLSIFDLSMYASSINSTLLTRVTKKQVEDFFQANIERKEQRTETGRPVYYYFPRASSTASGSGTAVAGTSGRTGLSTGKSCWLTGTSWPSCCAKSRWQQTANRPGRGQPNWRPKSVADIFFIIK
ncbi:hypothetical protein BOX15_Mlig000271g1, partial [Macrostomum lignano]